MKLINVLSFDFVQSINKKNKNGFCIIKYSKKIFCEYGGPNKKIIVSNGRSLVIKNENSGNYNIYPLNKTPLELLLDKEYLLSKIIILEPKYTGDKFVTFKIFDNNNKINIFFDKKTFNLMGWQTEDIYQNITTTFMSSIKINHEVDEKLFILPIND